MFVCVACVVRACVARSCVRACIRTLEPLNAGPTEIRTPR